MALLHPLDSVTAPRHRSISACLRAVDGATRSAERGTSPERPPA
jgi:hypothetical protein